MLTPEEVAWLRSRLAIHERTYKVFALAWVTLGLTFLIDMPDRIGGALRAGTIVLGMFGGCTMMRVTGAPPDDGQG